MAKTISLAVRMTATEVRAVKRFARSKGTTFADLVRSRVINAALSHDPKQTEFPLQEKGATMRATG